MRWIALPIIMLILSGCGTLRHLPYDSAVSSYPAPSLHAEAPPPLSETEPLTLEAAIQRALTWDLARSSLEAEANWVQARQSLRGTGRAPQVRFDFGENNGFTRTRYGLRIYPPTPWGHQANARRTEYMARFTETHLRAEEHDIAMRIRRGYLGLYQDVRTSQHLKKIVDVRKQQFQSVRDMVRAGEGVVADQMRAQLDLLEAISDLDDVERRRQQLCNELATLLGLSEGISESDLDLTSVKASLGAVEQLPYEDLVHIAYEHRPDLAAVAWRRRIAEIDLSAARKLRIPWFSHIQGTVEDEDAQSGDSWSIQTAVDIPIGGDTGARIAREEAQQEHYAAQMEMLQRRIANDVRLSVLHAEHAATVVEKIENKRYPHIKNMMAELDEGGESAMLRADLQADLYCRLLEVDQARLEAMAVHELAMLQLIDVTGSAIP